VVAAAVTGAARETADHARSRGGSSFAQSIVRMVHIRGYSGIFRYQGGKCGLIGLDIRFPIQYDLCPSNPGQWVAWSYRQRTIVDSDGILVAML